MGPGAWREESRAGTRDREGPPSGDLPRVRGPQGGSSEPGRGRRERDRGDPSLRGRRDARGGAPRPLPSDAPTDAPTCALMSHRATPYGTKDGPRYWRSVIAAP